MSEPELIQKPTSSRPGRRALTMLIIANGVSLVGTIVLVVILLANIDYNGRVRDNNLLLGVLAVPFEAMPVFFGVFALQLLLAIFGIIALVMAIVAAVRNAGRGPAIAGIIIGLVVPTLSIIVFLAVAGTRIVLR